MSRLRWIAGTVAGAGLLLVSGASAVSTNALLTVSPSSGLLDAPFSVRVTGLDARSAVQLRLREAAFPRGTLTLRRTVSADARGIVDLPRSKLLALVAPANANAAGITPRFTREITVSVVSGGKTLATTHATRFVAPASVAVRELRPAQGGLYGEYQVPASASKHTAVLLIGGSDGGMPNGYAASLLAAHGYPVLALAYFGEPGLPPSLENIRLEYFQRALAWLGRWDAQRVCRIAAGRPRLPGARARVLRRAGLAAVAREHPARVLPAGSRLARTTTRG
jgi:hypothetical protein